MVAVIKDCRRESGILELRPWWEPPYVVYGFSNPQVRRKLEELMGSYVVRSTDKDYMLLLARRIREVYQEMARKRIKDREEAELDREKLLILEGEMPMEMAPKGLSDHPVFRITLKANKILEEMMLKEEKLKRRKKLKWFDYSLLEGMEEEQVEDTEMSSCIDDEDEDEDKMRKLAEMEDYIGEGEVFTENDYFRIKYEDPLVEELQDMETVDELYEFADEIVGALSGKRCGGLLKK